MAGLGAAFARGHLPALQLLGSENGFELVAAADPNASQRAAAAVWLPGVPVFGDAEEMLATVRSDLLVVASEPGAHALLALLGARYGQHVLCEKPLTLARGQHDLLAASFAQRAELALIAVHQYRYSRSWQPIARWARILDRLGVPFELAVDVQRNGTDRHAETPWRADIGASGGMLADHGVHFLALAWTISSDLRVLGGARAWDRERLEHSGATVRFGSGTLTLHVCAGAPTRRTDVELRAAGCVLGWRDSSAHVAAGGRTLGRWRVAALSDRRHVDELYVPLYRDVAAGLCDGSWRRQRTSEALAVGSALVSLLELTGDHAAAQDHAAVR